MSYRMKALLVVLFVCFIGIVSSTLLIDKQIDQYISEIKTNVDINISVIDNNNNNVSIYQNGDDIEIHIDPEPEEVEIIEQEFTIRVSSEIGLNIRQEPTISSDRVGTYYYGEEVKVIKDHGDWYETEDGFIFKEYTIKI